jgi:hypothetical protein
MRALRSCVPKPRDMDPAVQWESGIFLALDDVGPTRVDSFSHEEA